MGVENKPAHLPRSREFNRKGPSSFATFVPWETIQDALFNYWEPSLGLDTGRSDMPATVYMTQIDRYSKEGALNIIIIEDHRRANNRTRVDWYFGTFRGKHSGQVETDAEKKEFWDKLGHIYSRHHRIAGSELNSLIRHAGQLDSEHPLSWD
ncbi:MAG: hypothetical protein A2798_02895 [Candidatus Levybacteria bacterium RIFCSPHIGHO2_01_FULL_37_17]|nr:MAG: hypothetical protein A2798_02895 [Candidatus Levybacteria bacterium RIFCSPHIGHO2_01_FULL_37_17]OGH36804.1 MAG: hypothetical protein A2959_00885 [Candidatus Levybacteria bacterium RIFCSPLOWO2_01_FULL_38_23]